VSDRFDDINFLENASEVLRALAHPQRLAIVHLLRGGKKLSVTEIHQQIDIEQAVASHHLRILKDRDVLLAQRDGKNIFYALRSEAFQHVLEGLEKGV
jgi:ArsR family transcriptional regulator